MSRRRPVTCGRVFGSIDGMAQTPEGWLAALLGIDDAGVRRVAAGIVWWDVFGERSASDPWPHLDALRAGPLPADVDMARVQAALRQCGYAEGQAAVRGRPIVHGVPTGAGALADDGTGGGAT